MSDRDQGDMLPSFAELRAASTDTQRDVLTRLFEHSTRLERLCIFALGEPCDTYEAFVDDIQARLTSLVPPASSVIDPDLNQDVRALDDIFTAHPRLGEKKTNLSASSAAEQTKLQSRTDDAEAQELKRLNEEYESRFSGLRYLVFVNGRGRPEIFANMRMRIERGDPREERKENIRALCDIARDRLSKSGVAA